MIDQEELGGPGAVSARYRALVLVDEALGTVPAFRWQGEGAGSQLVLWRDDADAYYCGWFARDDGVLWGVAGGAPAGGRREAVIPDRHRATIDAVGMPHAPGICLWWDGTRWCGEETCADDPVPLLGPLLGDEAAAEWVDWHHGLPDLVEPMQSFLAVVAAGVPMTPHALVAFSEGVDHLNALMRRAAVLGLGAMP